MRLLHLALAGRNGVCDAPNDDINAACAPNDAALAIAQYISVADARFKICSKILYAIVMRAHHRILRSTGAISMR